MGGYLRHLLCLAVLLCVLPHRSALAEPLPLLHATHLFDLTGGFEKPSDVAVSTDGRAYVVDGVNHRVVVFDQSGAQVSSFGGQGSRAGRFQSPLGVAVGRSGKVYVADSGNHRVQVFQPGGTYASTIALPGGSRGQADPTDVAVDEEAGFGFVVDNDNHQVFKIELSTGSVLTTMGSYGNGRRQFRHPFFIEHGRDHKIFVVEPIGTRVQVLSADGHFVDFIGGWGVDRGEFFRPKGVAIDADDRVFVSDSYLGVIQVFSPSGKFLAAIGDPQRGALMKFEEPVGLFVDADLRLYVVEMSRDRVRVFQLEEAPGSP